MNKKDASVAKILTELGLREEKPLSEDQEYAYRYAIDVDFRFAEDLKRTFAKPQPEEKQ